MNALSQAQRKKRGREEKKKKWQDAERDEARKERGTVEGVFYI